MMLRNYLLRKPDDDDENQMKLTCKEKKLFERISYNIRHDIKFDLKI